MDLIYDKIPYTFRETRVSQGSLVLAEQTQIRTSRIRSEPEPKSVKEKIGKGGKEGEDGASNARNTTRL